MMKILLVTAVAASLVMFSGTGVAADKGNAKAELQELFTKIQSKLAEGKKTENDLAVELKQFDALLEQHKGEKTDDVAQILLMKAMLYAQVLEDADKGIELFKKLKTDFPETKQGKGADETMASIQRQKEGIEIQKKLAVGAKFPDFAVKDFAGKPLSVANYKGKVVLIDFWATWCGPCIAELPTVLKTYEKHHAKGFEIIGISLDNDEKALKTFIEKRKMPWQQFFDGKGWQTSLAEKYGIRSIPATYLLDGDGKIVAKSLRGEALEAEVAKLLAKP